MVELLTIGRTKLEHIDEEITSLTKIEKEELAHQKAEQSLVKVHPRRCPEVFSKLSVNWDGTATACCSDSDGLMILGNNPGYLA